LAKLYCLQARFDEAEVLSKYIILIKPYHFVALETMVATYLTGKNTLAWTNLRSVPRPPFKSRITSHLLLKDSPQATPMEFAVWISRTVTIYSMHHLVVVVVVVVLRIFIRLVFLTCFHTC
jgi:hypothetical protein